MALLTNTEDCADMHVTCGQQTTASLRHILYSSSSAKQHAYALSAAASSTAACICICITELFQMLILSNWWRHSLQSCCWATYSTKRQQPWHLMSHNRWTTRVCAVFGLVVSPSVRLSGFQSTFWAHCLEHCPVTSCMRGTSPDWPNVVFALPCTRGGRYGARAGCFISSFSASHLFMVPAFPEVLVGLKVHTA